MPPLSTTLSLSWGTPSSGQSILDRHIHKVLRFPPACKIEQLMGEYVDSYVFDDVFFQPRWHEQVDERFRQGSSESEEELAAFNAAGAE